MSALIDKLRKLQALAQRGEGGEAENAGRILYELMERHGITLDDIEQEKPVEVEIDFRGKDLKFVMQIIASELGPFRYNRFGSEKIMYILQPPSVGKYLITKIQFFYDLYQQELDKFYEAFLLKNDLYAKDDGTNSGKEPTPEEMDRMYEVYKMAKGIKRETMNKSLN